MGFLKEVARGSIKMICKHKETILLGGGLVAGVGTVVLACRATMKAPDILAAHNDMKDQINQAAEIGDQLYSEKDKQVDTVKNYIRTGRRLALAYAPAAALGATSAFCFIAQHRMLQNKVVKLEETVAGLTAAYAAIDTAFKNYRKRVVDKYGEEEDRYFRYGIKDEKIEVTESDEKGKTKKHKEVIKSVEKPDISDYAKFFTYDNEQFRWMDAQHHRPDWDANIRFLNCQQAYANQKLELQGYLFLNDVYDMLGLPLTKAGQVVGWIFDPENKSVDSYVNFGIFEPRNHRTINGYEEECILLDFNVDGPIIDRIPGMWDH